MKKIVIPFILCLAFLQNVPAIIAESDSSDELSSAWSGGVEIAATNKYLWRGMTVNEGFILQPLVWLTYQNFTFSLWNSTTLNEPKNDIKRPEVDATISYTLELKNFSIESYFSYYKYIDQNDVSNTGEVGCTLGYPVGIFTLNNSIIVDVIEYSGATYLEQKFEAEKDLNDIVTAYAALTLGSGLKKFNEAYLGLSKSTLSLLSLEGRLTYTTIYDIYVQPYFQLNKTMDNSLTDYLKKKNSVFGLTIGKEF